MASRGPSPVAKAQLAVAAMIAVSLVATACTYLGSPAESIGIEGGASELRPIVRVHGCDVLEVRTIRLIDVGDDGIVGIPDEDEDDTVLWLIVADTDPVPLTAVEMGTTPDGFEEVVVFDEEAINPDERYGVQAQIGPGSTAIQFQFGDLEPGLVTGAAMTNVSAEKWENEIESTHGC